MFEPTFKNRNSHSLSDVSDQTLSILKSYCGNQTIVELSGRVVSTTAGSLLDALSVVLSDGCKSLRLDLSGVNEISRAGVRGIVIAAKIMQARGGDFQITGARASVRATLDGLMLRNLISNSIRDHSTDPIVECPGSGDDKTRPIKKPVYFSNIGRRSTL